MAQQVQEEVCEQENPGLSEVENLTKELIKTVDPHEVQSFVVEDKNKEHWILTFRFGPTLNYYNRSDFNFKNDRMDVHVKDLQFSQRTSMDYYKVWKINDQQPLQFIDEPTNQMVLQVENAGKYAFGLRAVHSKTVIRSSYDVYQKGKVDPNDNVQVTGTIDGEAVDQSMNIHQLFDNIEISKLFYNVEIYAQKLIPVVTTKNTQINFKLGGAVGIYAGTTNTLPSGGFKSNHDDKWVNKMQTMGKNASLKTGFDVNYRKLVISADYNLVMGQLKWSAAGGKAEIPFLMGHNFSLGLGMKLYDSKNAEMRKLKKTQRALGY